MATTVRVECQHGHTLRWSVSKKSYVPIGEKLERFDCRPAVVYRDDIPHRVTARG